MNEWLLAEGDIQARGSIRRINDYFLSPAGPRLNPAQRDWLQQMGQRPLRLYDVTDVVQGQQMTLCDALDKEAEPMVVRERSGTKDLKPDELLGCRILRVADHFEMSGSACLFSLMTAPRVLSLLREHYQAVGQQLDGPRKMGQIRARVHINPGKKADQLELFYRTQRYADEGRVWFDALAFASVTFVKRKVQVSADVMAASQQQGPQAVSKNGKRASASGPKIDADTLARLMAEVIHRTYANWADEPIPALNHKTPRQAVKTSAGLERVEGLLRSYEAGEVSMAKKQGRPEISYAFLWQALGITR